MNKDQLQERDYYLALSLFGGIGPVRLGEIIKHFGSVKKFYHAKSSDLKSSGLNYSIQQRWQNFRVKTDLVSYKIRLEKRLIKYLTIEDSKYPKLLAQIPNPPILIYYQGTFSVQDKLTLAVIGSRKPTSYGREVTEKFTRELVRYGFTIVSGLARGVDSIAHRVALGQGGRTIAVLGSSLDIIYPPEHAVLAKEIAKNGVLISEYALGQKATPRQFPARNRIISGLSLGVLITEGASKSGTKITAGFAADQGREVFSIPGPINSLLSAGPAELIKVGAKLTSNVNDILEELHWQQLIPNPDKQKQKSKPKLSLQEEKIWQALSGGGKSSDQLIQGLGISPSKVLSILTDLELRGLVKNIGDGIFILS